MAKKALLLGMLAISLASGCVSARGNDLSSDDPSHNKGYTLEFKVEYYNGFVGGVIGGAITQIEFIDGASGGDPVLLTETVNLSSREMSKAYRVSGFSNTEGDGRIFGVRLTLKNGKTWFDWGTAAENGDKIKVHFSGPLWVMQFSDGNW
jgi:hypothetical protein